MTDEEKILDRIRKLLALAGRNENENEAQAALIQAQAMMARHGITHVPEAGQAPAVEKVEQGIAVRAGRLENWRVKLGMVIADNFRCRLILQSAYRDTRVLFIGNESDLAIATAVYQAAEQMAVKQCEAYLASRPQDIGRRRKLGTDWKTGFAAGLWAKFQKQKEDNNWGLVLAIPVQVDQYMEKAFPKTKDVSVGLARRPDTEAFERGHEKGQEFGSGHGESRKERGPKLLN